MPNDIMQIDKKEEAEEWSNIVSTLLDSLDVQDFPDDVLRATEMMLVGMPTYKIGKRLGVSTATVRGWLTKYPAMSVVVANGKKLLAQWRLGKLEQQFLTALERSEEVLEVGIDGFYEGADGAYRRVDPKVLTVIAAQARYIIGLFAGQKIDVSVTHELGDTLLKARADALDYLADRLAAQDDGSDLEPIEAVVRVIDAKMDNDGPSLDPDGNAPFGTRGILSRDKEGSLCHICGNRYKSLARHLDTKHGTTTDEYEMTYDLEDGWVRKLDNE